MNIRNTPRIDDGYNKALDNVLDDIDSLFMSLLPPIPSQQSNDTKSEDTISDNLHNKPKISVFKSMEYGDILQLKDHIFIPKDSTQRLAQYIVTEEWGKHCVLLYKYIDYIFRCQAFKKQIISINDKYLIFHSGLQRRNDKEFLYLLLIRNKKYDGKYIQKWRVQYGDIWNSFLTKKELLSRFSDSYLIEARLPQRTRFYNDLGELLYDDTMDIEVFWEQRLITNKDRIRKMLGNIAFFDDRLKIVELKESFDIALKETQRMAQLNPRLAVAQGFVDTKHCKFRMELLLPLNVEFPRYSKNYYRFALAISKSRKDNAIKYVSKSILTMDMAYANARLIGYVDSKWLRFR